MEASRDPSETAEIASCLLAWYRDSARDLPWRAQPGQAARPDPYRVWLSEIMLQQTTVAAVVPYFETFIARWPDVAALAAAREEAVFAAWAGLGYYARARNLVACARAVAARGGFPDTEDELRALPGIGAYTAAAIAAIAFHRRAVVIDANVERVAARLFAIATPLPAAKKAIRAAVDTITPEVHAGDFAQAMMDLGAGVCTARDPDCAICPLREHCAAAAAGDPALLPVKPPKKARPQRRGTAFWIERDGHVLLVERERRGLLGGMRALPDDGWTARADGGGDPPVIADWTRLEETVSHGFTHFTLDLAIMVTHEARDCGFGQWWPVAEIADAGLPTVFARVARLVMAGRDGEKEKR